MAYGNKKLDGGHAASHGSLESFPILAPPSHGKEKVTIREELNTVGCWKLDDVRFFFDSSFVLPDSKPEFTEFASIRNSLPGAPISLFGHADPVGDDNYNKVLSGRRAEAIYAILTRDVALFEALYSNSEGTGDDWKLNHIQIMLKALGFDPGTTSGSMTAQSKQAVKDYQSKNDLVDDGDPGPKTRAKLFQSYMDFLCPVTVPKSDFLGEGADPGGKAAYQGCSEFNPLMLFSAQENQAYSAPAKKAERNAENSTNRRVMGLFFRPGTKVPIDSWPCPRANEGTAACTKRLWSDAATRRQFQAKRRTFADDRDTFACRFYERLVEFSPCEAPVVPLNTELRGYLRLTFLDPEGNPHPFPKDMPVIVNGGGAKQTEKTTDDGKLEFDFDRAKGGFTLEFEHPDHYVAIATDKSSHAEKNRWLAAADLDAAVKDFFHVFKLPKEWSLTTSDWAKPDTSLYKEADFRFEGLTPPGVKLGDAATPVELQLNPHWHFVRLEFFDRAFGHAGHSGKRIGIPPVLLEGFRDGSTDRGPVPNPDTRSNWELNPADPATQTQALPWILQRKADESADARPTAKILLQFTQPENTFISSTDAATRKIEVVADAAKRAASPDRMALYDLPQLWKSSKYFTRGDATNKWFHQLTDADILTSADKSKPLTFSLDDMVLVKTDGAPDPSGGDDLALIFFHQFQKPATGHADIKDQGVWKLGADATKPFFPYSEVKMPVKYYLHDYPDWTRVIIVNGNMYESFADRTPDTGAHEVIGARAATMWVDSVAAGQPPTNQVNPRPAATTKPFFSIQPFFCQDMHVVRSQCMPAGAYNEATSPIASLPGFVTGRYDQTLLRCCDRNGANEVALNFNFFRFFFDFTTPPATNGDGTPFNNNDYKRKMLENVPKRWNGPETVTLTDGSSIVTNTGDYLYKSQTPGALPLECRPFLYCQDVPRPRAHFLLNIINIRRANMNGSSGVGNFSADNETHTPATGWFTAAHEVGHGYGLPDEYNERWSANACSYQFAGFGSQVPGDPYSLVRNALMMEGVVFIENRYFWHSSEWVRRVVNQPLQVESAAFQYFLPQHAQAPNINRTFTYFPLHIRSVASNGTRGRFDTYLFPYGKDSYSSRLKAGVVYDGILCVLVKIRFRFDSAPAYTDVTRPIRNLINRVTAMMNYKFAFQGAFAPANFTNGIVHFMPRVLVETLVNDGTADNNAYLAGLGYNPVASATQADYTTKVNAVETNHPRHFLIRVVNSGATGWQNSNTLHLTSAQLRAADAWKWFADMVGIDCSGLANPATALTNAAVQSGVLRQAIPTGTVTTSA